MEQINELKLAVSAICAGLTALWGWFGWLIAAWWVCMAIDYITGTMAAKRAGKWSSSVAKAGVWHKVGCLVAALVAGIFDGVTGLLLANVPSLPFKYTVLFCPLVVAWYLLSEMGSILENATVLGAPVPRWFRAAIERLNQAVDDAGGEEKKE